MNLEVCCSVCIEIWRNVNFDAATYECLRINFIPHSGLLLAVGSIRGHPGDSLQSCVSGAFVSECMCLFVRVHCFANYRVFTPFFTRIIFIVHLLHQMSDLGF